MQLKRLKAELEAKCNEQEEELDEQAGTIQQLEQVCILQLQKVYTCMSIKLNKS